MNDNPDCQTLRRILKKKNVIFIAALGNQYNTTRKVYSENIKDGDAYKSASINSNLNNKITVV
jgi:hypothetical protein